MNTWNKVIHGWYLCQKRDNDGDLLHLPNNLSQRAEMLNALAEEGEWSDIDWMRVCSLSLDGLDNVLNDFEPTLNNKKSNAAPDRRGKVLQKAADKDTRKDEEDFWCNDAEAHPFRLGINEYVRTRGKRTCAATTSG